MSFMDNKLNIIINFIIMLEIPTKYFLAIMKTKKNVFNHVKK